MTENLRRNRDSDNFETNEVLIVGACREDWQLLMAKKGVHNSKLIFDAALAMLT